MKRRGSRRVWYIHHAESESLYKTYDAELAQQAEQQQADIINRVTYDIWKKKYGHIKEVVFEQNFKGIRIRG